MLFHRIVSYFAGLLIGKDSLALFQPS